MRKGEGKAEGGRTKIDVACTDECDIKWFTRVVCVLPGAVLGRRRVGYRTGIQKMSRKTGDTPIGELVGDIKHLGYGVSHFEGIWSKSAKWGKPKSLCGAGTIRVSKLLSCINYGRSWINTCIS